MRVFVFFDVASGVLTTKKAIFVLTTQTTATTRGEEAETTRSGAVPSWETTPVIIGHPS